MAQRATFQGGAQAWADGLRDFVASHGRLFCTYPCEEQNLAKASLHIESVNAHHDLLSVLKKLQPNLSFPKKAVTDGMRILVAELSDTLGLKPDQKADYIETMTNRIRCLGRVVSQGDTKNKDTPWVRELPWNRDDDSQETKPAAGDEAGKADTKQKPAAGDEAGKEEYIYDLNEELVVCIRMPMNGGKNSPVCH